MYDEAKYIILYGPTTTSQVKEGTFLSCCPHLSFGTHLCKLRGIAKVKHGWTIFIQQIYEVIL